MKGRGNKRISLLYEYIKNKGYVSVNDLISEFNISKSTVIRDLEFLHKEGQVARVHGGAIPINSDATPKYDLREIINSSLKENIGRAAASLVKDNDEIFIDAGSTCYEFYKQITAKNVTVFTCNLAIVSHKYKPNIKHLYTLEGEVSHSSSTIGGSLTSENMKRINPSKVFFSSTGLSQECYIQANSEFELSGIKAVNSMSGEKIYLIDSSKIYATKLFKAVPLSSVNYLITDDNISPDRASTIKSLVKNLMIV